MTTIRPETNSLLDAVEQFAHRKFHYREEMAVLIELAQSTGGGQILDQITFHAKFISHAVTIMKRVGTDTDETAKLSAEFTRNLETTSELLHTLIDNAPEEIQNRFSTTFLSVSHESMNSLLDFLHDLSWLKNYSLDRGTA
ncbi:MAG: hypothetical protein HYR76_07700 [Ignavibacteria bacterium]|nr:hypothetical protein [Ignavibacteria bacterium]MBI3765439.1 hypothetical protein [Ignavibacteriales bacterium]